MTEAISSVPPLTTFFGRIPSQSNSNMSSQEEELDECDTECWSYDEAEYYQIAQNCAEPVVADPTVLTSSTDPVSDVSVISDDPSEWIPDDKLRERLAS